MASCTSSLSSSSLQSPIKLEFDPSTQLIMLRNDLKWNDRLLGVQQENSDKKLRLTPTGTSFLRMVAQDYNAGAVKNRTYTTTSITIHTPSEHTRSPEDGSSGSVLQPLELQINMETTDTDGPRDKGVFVMLFKINPDDIADSSFPEFFDSLTENLEEADARFDMNMWVKFG